MPKPLLNAYKPESRDCAEVRVDTLLAVFNSFTIAYAIQAVKRFFKIIALPRPGNPKPFIVVFCGIWYNLNAVSHGKPERHLAASTGGFTHGYTHH